MPTITASRFTNVWRARFFVTLLAAVFCGTVYAQNNVTIDDLTQRAEAGERTAMRSLAEAYYAGRHGAEQDFVKAAEWYRRLARQGDVRAQTSLGLMYARGYGVPKDLAQAHRWWNFAAVQNDPGAQYNLGLTYVQGEGVDVDYERAARWFREAARRGHVQAQYNYGLLLHEGKGVKRDPQQAYYWIKVAALQGDNHALKSVAKLASGLPEDQKKEADDQAEVWMEKVRKLAQ